MDANKRIEFVAQAITPAIFGHGKATLDLESWEVAKAASPRGYQVITRITKAAVLATLQSLLEPSEGMVEAAEDVPMNRYSFMGGEESDIYRAMIQQAIKEMGDA